MDGEPLLAFFFFGHWNIQPPGFEK